MVFLLVLSMLLSMEYLYIRAINHFIAFCWRFGLRTLKVDDVILSDGIEEISKQQKERIEEILQKFENQRELVPNPQTINPISSNEV